MANSPAHESDRILSEARSSLTRQQAGGRRSIGRRSAEMKRQHIGKKAARMAMAVGAPELAKIWLLSEANARAVLAPSAGISTNDLANLANLESSLSRIGNAVKGIAASAASPFALVAGQVASDVAGVVEFAQSKTTIEAATRKLRRVFGLEDFGEGGKEVVGGVERALNDNTKALRENTIMINGQRNFVGGAGRLRGAVPTSLRQERLDDFIDGQGVELGIL
ncbi:MAG: hypothetical protein IH945_01975 [Armatimonadetes bacterium]|nr:hypothetical protein [Armatimonadota bacterium]